MTMLCTLIRGQMSYTFFQLGGHMSGGGGGVGGVKCPTLQLVRS